MKVFLSWSGEHAKKLAGLLMDWLPNVIQSIEPWTSEEIGKGARWSDEIARELDESRFGILCVDREHLTSPWIHFEAGAIAKSVQGATARNRVTPLLLGIDEADLRDPLALFQATKLEREDLFRLIRSLNEVQDAPLDMVRLTKAFDRWWPELDSDIGHLEANLTAKASTGEEVGAPRDDILEELLHIARDQRRALARLEQTGPVDRPFWRADSPGRLVFGGASDERARPLDEKLAQLEWEARLITYHSNHIVTVSLRGTPPHVEITDFNRWAIENLWVARLETPDGIYRLGLSHPPGN
jgi:hypothetical protein